MINHRIKLIKGDITTLRTDAIVNAANTTLLGGGGVDGAIHAAAGHELLKECETLNGCRTGEAKITKGYKLPARHVIHTVGPVWHGGNYNEDELLAACYRNSLVLAVRSNIRTIAFPNISTGVYHFPMPRAAKIAINEVLGFLKTDERLEQVIFVCFGNENFNLYSRLLEEAGIDLQEGQST
ncbi:MAG TPA: O-acetyl-ADP-ribose deacetylase [Bacteroidales bacterium]|nr:O-acetyl-ADP-ribose deacetylase [Bacteroidales bacterium]